ncbi:MAG: Asp23/Gls24 family envelope stress response protein [Bacillota bacterium]
MTETPKETGEKGQVISGSEGEVRISNDVLAVIAGIAAGEIPGVAGMVGGLVENISEKLGRHDLRRGVKIDARGNTVSVALHISVEYGCRIPDAARKLQAKIKEAIENMTDLEVTAVDIHVQEVVFPEDRKKDISGQGSDGRDD